MKPSRSQAFCSTPLLTCLLAVISFCLALEMHPGRHALQGMRPDADDPLARVLGEGRKLFANHVFLKADVYFHNGYYPTIFDNRSAHQTPHLAEDAGLREGKNEGDEESFLGPPANWIDAHGRRHFPSRHTHLGEEIHTHEEHSHDHDHDHAHGHEHGHGDESSDTGSIREVLPWLKASSRLDPGLIESYTVAAFWLRKAGKHAEAADFVQQGLKANPGHPELLFELGHCRLEAGNVEKARSIWEGAWKQWKRIELAKKQEDQDRFLAQQILLHLAMAESRMQAPTQCLEWLNVLLPYAASPDAIRERIKEVSSGQPFTDLKL
ncbi:MAG: tetratricopeptide repeat protein [Verrucomicrobia bacterium]|nr:tetratricopeptide repeat protein [Verrucomicrobiota bacterium]